MTKKDETPFRYPPEIKKAAKEMYLRGAFVQDIAQQTNVPARTIYDWRDKEKWDDEITEGSPEEILVRRIAVLSGIDNKTKAQLDELDRAFANFANLKQGLAKANKIQAEADYIRKHGIPVANYPKPSGNNGSKEKKPREAKKDKVKNDISSITPEMLSEAYERLFTCDYTRIWREAKENELTRRTRFILKSRQIGATYYFSWEAFEDAVLTGDNQIFLSASRAQAEVFKGYIVAFCKTEFDIELKGSDVITLSNGANLRFLSTNATTAQSYTGHLYIDEVFWIPKFEKVNHVAGAIATHKKWRKTYFSTPSAKSHQAYPMWSGEQYNNKLPEKKRAAFDVSHDNLKNGQLFPDKIWRHIVTVEDAVAQGFDLIDVEMLRTESPSEAAFDNLYMCKFIDDSESVFNLENLLRCVVDAEEWADYKTENARPFGNNPVSIGYDTGLSANGDAAQRSLLAIPLTQKEAFRLLGLRKLRGQNFEYQAGRLKEDVDSHNVEFIGLDLNGMGTGVHEHVVKFFPNVTPLNYTPENKNRLVTKMIDLINTKRFQLLRRDQDVITSFLLIKKTISNGSGAIIYKTERRAAGGHGDSAWSIINGVSYEPLAGVREESRLAIQH